MQPYMHESHVYKTLFELFSKMKMPLLTEWNSYCSFVRQCVVYIFGHDGRSKKKEKKKKRVATAARYTIELKHENMSEPSKYVNNETFFAGVTICEQ